MTESITLSVPSDAAFGQAVWLMMNMPMYRHCFIGDLDWMVLPPIMLNQYHFFQANGCVVAFTAWGYLSDAAEERLGSPNARVAPADWKSGERLCLVHLFAPFGHHEQVLKELRETSLAGKSVKIRRLGPDGQSVTEVLPAVIKNPGAT
jgi:cytolysin-activating lysine-acyltransferase